MRARDTETAEEASAGVRWLYAFGTRGGDLVWERTGDIPPGEGETETEHRLYVRTNTRLYRIGGPSP